MPHREGHENPNRADRFRERVKLNLRIRPVDPRQFGSARTEELLLQKAFGAHQAAFRRRRTRFRETRGLFTTGLNLSRLRALSSIR